jgi:hypothetical protein
MNEYFCNIAVKIHNELPNLKHKITSPSTPGSILLNFTSAEEVFEIIGQMKPKTSLGGLDKFSMKQIKCVADIIAHPLSILYNKCIENAIFPEILKISKVIPIYKGGQMQDPTNYRPISLQSVFSKIFERIIKVRVSSYLESKSLLSPFQYGFRSKSSTTMALIDLVHTIKNNQNKKKHTLIIFLDLKKAFDTVDHGVLLAKLELFGCRDKVLQLFSSYLASRKQYTQINNKVSPLEEIKYGVPQGSILGPLLFLIYINDIETCKPEMGDIKLFADDTAIIIKHENLDTLNKLGNLAIRDTHNWLTMNKQSLNLEKTFGLYISANKKGNKVWLPKIMLGDTQIKTVDSIKYLGMILDDKLCFKDHINKLINKLRKWIGIFRKIRGLLNQTAKKTLYNSIFHPNLLYAIELFGNASKTTIKGLQTIQNKALRALYGYPRLYSTKDMYKELKILKIKPLFMYRATILMDKLIKQTATLNIHFTLKEYCTQMEHKYYTRKKDNFNLKFDRPSFTSSNSFRLYVLWNDIPTDIKNSQSVTTFKNDLYSYFLNSQK